MLARAPPGVGLLIVVVADAQTVAAPDIGAGTIGKGSTVTGAVAAAVGELDAGRGDQRNDSIDIHGRHLVNDASS